MELTKMEQSWVDFIVYLSGKKPTAYVQIRKMFRNEMLIIPFKDFDGTNLQVQNLGYAEGKTKMNQLVRNYLNEDELIRIREAFKEREGKSQTCLTARFGALEKRKDSMGFCMQTITLNYFHKPEPGNPRFTVEIYYRSTEIVQKFFADLMFLEQIVFPILLDGLPEPDEIRFNFSNIYLSSMFLPVFMQVVDLPEYLEYLKESDQRWFSRTVSGYVNKCINPDCIYNYQTMAKMWRIFQTYVLPNLSRQQLRKIKRITKR